LVGVVPTILSSWNVIQNGKE